MNIKSVLLNIAHELKEDPIFLNIDRGGCCWFAGLIAEQLERKKIPFTFVLQDPISSVEDLEEQANNETNGYSARHLYLKIDGLYYDSGGILNSEQCEYDVHVEWTAEQISNFYKNGRGSWNTTFNHFLRGRKREIRAIVKNNFKQYDTKDSTRH